MDQRTFRQSEARIVLREDLAEMADRSEQLMRRQMLIAKHQHRTIDKDIVEVRPRCLVDRPGEVDAADFRPGMLGELWRPCSPHQPVSIGRFGSAAHSPSEAS